MSVRELNGGGGYPSIIEGTVTLDDLDKLNLPPLVKGDRFSVSVTASYYIHLYSLTSYSAVSFQYLVNSFKNELVKSIEGIAYKLANSVKLDVCEVVSVSYRIEGDFVRVIATVKVAGEVDPPIAIIVIVAAIVFCVLAVSFYYVVSKGIDTVSYYIEYKKYSESLAAWQAYYSTYKDYIDAIKGSIGGYEFPQPSPPQPPPQPQPSEEEKGVKVSDILNAIVQNLPAIVMLMLVVTVMRTVTGVARGE